jgi:hypothetical protein
MYMAPFRLKHAPKTPPVNTTYYGPVMNSDVLPLADGPLLGGQVAGGVTRWMAIPWQTDTASCRDGYTTQYDPYLPTFWPARVPNNILSEDRYKQTIDPSISEQTRQQAFALRYDWLDNLPLDGKPASYTNQINSMTKYFDKLAVVQKRPGLPDDPNFPDEMQVAIIPNREQENALLQEFRKHLADVLEKRSKTNKNISNALQSAAEKISDKQLLENEDLQKDVENQLALLMENEITDDHDLKPHIQRLLSLFAAKRHKVAKSSPMRQQKQRVEVGVPEKMNRFTRYVPK